MVYISKRIVVLLLLFSMPVCTVAADNDLSTVGVVNIEKVLENSSLHQEMKKDWEKYKNRLFQQIQYSSQNVANQLNRTWHVSSNQSREEFMRKRLVLQKKRKVLLVRERRIKEFVKNKHEKLKQKTYNRINRVVESLTEELRFPIVTRGNKFSRDQIFAPSVRDVTEQVLKKLE